MDRKPTYEELSQRIGDLEKKIDASGNIESNPEHSELLYRLILENFSDTVIVTDDEGKIVYVCPNTTKIFARRV